MPESVILEPVSAFAGLAWPSPERGEAGLVVSERRGLGIATVTQRPGGHAGLSALLLQDHDLALTEGPTVSVGRDLAFVGIGPGQWLAVQPEGGWRFARTLGEALAGHAAVADQSSGYGVLRLSGPKARAVLAKGVPIDLHPAVFRPGDAAVTLAGHVGIVLWQVDAAPIYDVAVFRSFAGSFWHWLTESAAEFGLAVE
jgi:heterotetrameric sarcosine oxidase gamma subunit